MLFVVRFHQMPQSRMHARPGGLTRRSLLGGSFAAMTGLLLAGCGGAESGTSAGIADEVAVDGESGLRGVRIKVWRDPG